MKIFRNPILPGFYPDPSVCRVGKDFYLVASTFAYFPGVPIFHSTDLIHWRQIGNVLDRPGQLPLEGAEVSRGIFAPTIRYHDGTFYMITTNVSGGGNFVVTATEPRGPWSDPHYIEGANGIDPSLFFDTDGKCYYHGTCERREGGKYYGDNEIYLQELDLAKMELVGERHAIWHSALKNAVWPEGPHVYKIGEYYYLLISEGGTAHEHAITVARSKTLTGYYEGHKCNPILTHRHLGRDYPIVNVGHGDLVETPSGEWWMVLLASRPYGGRYRNLGRETFLVPVSWEDGWPVANYGIGLVQETERAPDLAPGTGKFCTSYDFGKIPEFPMNMLFLRNPATEDYAIKNSDPEKGLHLRLNKNPITKLNTVSYCCIRQQHMSFGAHAHMQFRPDAENECAGLVIFQNHKYHYQFVLTLKNDDRVLRLIKCDNGEETILAEHNCKVPTDAGIFLRIIAKGQELSFGYGQDGQNYTVVCGNADARILSTDVAGGFVGTTIGMYASSNGVEAGGKFARFGEFAYNGYEGE
ncbi:MAG: glycoside hydrolase family 43 protein [Treponema sp.]|nr:glycoside hydrolase family 43 protein [Treponema sp.]